MPVTYLYPGAPGRARISPPAARPDECNCDPLLLATWVLLQFPSPWPPAWLNPMNRLAAGLVIAGLVLIVGVTPAGGAKPTASDQATPRAARRLKDRVGFNNTALWRDDASQRRLRIRSALQQHHRERQHRQRRLCALQQHHGLWQHCDRRQRAHTQHHRRRQHRQRLRCADHNTRGEANTATGSSALFSNTTGGGNTATGIGALYSNTIGHGNTATGGALYSNTTGHGNTATGGGALDQNITGRFNTAARLPVPPAKHGQSEHRGGPGRPAPAGERQQEHLPRPPRGQQREQDHAPGQRPDEDVHCRRVHDACQRH